jgi:tRNA (mo5U34)-methyltransferase
MNIEDLDESTDGGFDITFCFGILYHLENPILSMKRLASVTKNIMLVDTDVMRTRFIRRPLWRMNFMDPDPNPESKGVGTSLWRKTARVVQFEPNETAVIELLKFLGFSNVTKIKPKSSGLEKRYLNGTRVTFLALRS